MGDEAAAAGSQYRSVDLLHENHRSVGRCGMEILLASPFMRSFKTMQVPQQVLEGLEAIGM